MVYDARGRLDEGRPRATRTRTYTYDAAKPFRLASRTDGMNRTVELRLRRRRARTARSSCPAAATYGFGYDDNGNRTSITMPNGKVARVRLRRRRRGHRLHATGRRRAGPAATTTTGCCPASPCPAAAARRRSDDTAGRKTGIAYATGEGSSTFTLEDGTDLQTQATRTLPGRSDTEATGHDGVLDTARTLSDGGGQYGSYGYEYGDDLQLDAIELKSGAETVRTEIERDADGLPTKFGPFTLTRGGPLGRVSEVEDDDLRLELGWDGRGRADGRTMTVAGTPRLRHAADVGQVGPA